MIENKIEKAPKRQPKPKWLRVPLPKGEEFQNLQHLTSRLKLNTVCQESGCPNLGECWSSGTATFMLLGDHCTRACRFCSVMTQKSPALPDPKEPNHLVESLANLNLKYLVLTTVDRDDLPDQGAGHIATSIQAIQKAYPELLIELLMPDFQGQTDLIDQIIATKPLVIGHNLECVRSVTEVVRDPRSKYDQSLEVLQYLAENGAKFGGHKIHVKSSLMVGFGETLEEVEEAMLDLRNAGVEFLTIGQYLQPTKTKLPVTRYVTPEEFKRLEKIGQSMGFSFVASGPLVRSSYKAFEFYMKSKDGQGTDKHSESRS